MPGFTTPAADNPPGRRRRLPGWADSLLFLVFLALCIVAITWPWAAGFGHAFAFHWDPPLHAWKVWNMADAILHGHIRPPGIDLNAYYPNTGSLYYESLYWPQGVVAAPVLAATGNPVLAFHLSYLFFWAFSGLCLRWLLLELGAGRAAASLGALVFTIIPYRTGYIVEFNMQLCFGLPLFLLFVLRWSKSQRPLDAALAATALCLQAASELYQAVFLCLCMPFVLFALLRGRWRAWLSSRRFWLSVAIAGCVTLVFVLVLFRPYLGQLDHSVSRPLREVVKHELEPFSYLASRDHMRWSLLPAMDVKQDEICVYPTLAVLAAALCLLARCLVARFASPEATRTERVLRVLRASALWLFLLATLTGILANTLGSVGPTYAWLPVAIALLSLAIPFVSRYRNDTDRFLDGLCGGAVFAFLMSLGPKLAVNSGPWHLGNPLFLGLYHASSVLHGFRVVSRFAIIVLLFLVLLVSMGWDRLLRAHAGGKGFRAVLVRLLWAPFLALVVFESIPAPLPPPREGTPLSLPFLDELQKETGEPLVLATIPGLNRYYDAMNMFRIAGADPRKLVVMSWGGAWPKFLEITTRNYERFPGRPAAFHRQFASIWPECFLLLDRGELLREDDETMRNAFARNLPKIADPIHSDERYTLYRFHPLPANTLVERWVRTDLMRERPIARFRIVPAPLEGDIPGEDATVSVALDRRRFAAFTVPEGGREFTLRLPDYKPDPVDPFCILFKSTRPIFLESFRLEPLADDAPAAPQPDSQPVSP